MIVTDELLLSLADGELDAPTAAKLRQAIAASPQLQADYAVFEESARLLREALDPGPLPERLISAINAAPVAEPGATTAGTGTATDPVVLPFTRRPIAQPLVWGAIAASLMLGVLISPYLGLTPGGETGPDLLAYATLPTGAEQQMADGGTVRVIGSYQSDAGLCRDILTETASLVRHDLICKSEGGWQLAFSLTAPAAEGYLPASDALTAGIDGFLNAIGAGSALSPAEERAALASP